MNVLPPNMRFGNRQSVKRLEDERLLTGRGLFVDDRETDGALWMVVLRSPHAHARIVSIDTTDALAMPGVEAIYTGADLVADKVGPIPTVPIFKRAGGSEPMAYEPRRALAHEKVRFAGEAVAAVIATSRSAAQDAAEAIAVDYDVLSAATDVVAAMEAGSALVCDKAPDNVAAETTYGDKDAVEKIFASAAHTVALDIVNTRLVPAALEPRSTFAEVEAETGRLILTAESQTPTGTRDILAGAVLGRAPDSVRVRVGDIGGGFGHKSGLYPEDIIVAYAATKLNKCVRWRGDRTDEFVAGTHGRDLTTHAEMAFDKDGKILGFRVRSLGGTGAYLTGTGVLIPLVLGPFVSTGTYHVPAIFYDIKAVMTHTAPVSAYRGAGRPEAIFIIERLLDTAARQIGIDPRDIRKVNYVRPDQFPYTNAVGQVYDSGSFAGLLDRLSTESDWNGYAARKADAEKRGKLYGRGLASYIEWTGGTALTETATLAAKADGKVVLYSATQAMGQGLQTSYTQLLADALELPMDRIEIVQGDTDLATGFGSVGSRSLFMGGAATAQCAVDLLDKARERAADRLEAAAADIEYSAGTFKVAGTDRAVSLFDIAKDESLSVKSEGKADGPSWPNGSHVVEVEIDPETGVTKVVKATSVDDVGIPMNPMIVTGQIHGGIAQGIGQALLEGVAYDVGGQLLTASFQDYCMPRADDVPSIDVNLDDRAPCLTNPLGAKGCGESGAVGAPPAVVNAVVDALASRGVKTIDMPITPRKVWHALHG